MKLPYSDTPTYFDFDLRYYVPYHDGELRRSGAYVFKTTDTDSHPFNHRIESIQVYKGNKL